MQTKSYIALCALATVVTTAPIAHAQMKIGANPRVINALNALDVEATNGNHFVVTKADAKVGIGTTAPSKKLEVVDTVGVSPLRFPNMTSTSTLPTAIGSTVPLSVDSNGDVVPVPITAKATLIAAKQTNQSIPSGGSGTVLTGWDESTDNANAFNPATGVFIAPRTAIYQVSYRCTAQVAQWLAGEEFSCWLRVNNNSTFLAGTFVTGSYNGYVTANASTSVKVNAGEPVDLYIWHGRSGGAITTHTGVWFNVSIQEL